MEAKVLISRAVIHAHVMSRNDVRLCPTPFLQLCRSFRQAGIGCPSAYSVPRTKEAACPRDTVLLQQPCTSACILDG